MEAHSGKVLLAANSEEKRPVASITKVATAKVALDWAARSQTSTSTLITVPQQALAFGGANPMNLKPGDRLALRDAIYSALLGSDNIAAYTLAYNVGTSILAQRRSGGDPVAAFVKEMNSLASAIGMKRTKFTNPHGLETSSKSGYSTAADIARLSVHVMRDVAFVFYVKQKSREIKVVGMDGRSTAFKVNNTNTLLGKMGINGIKTGFTTAAGQCITVNAHRSALVNKMANNQTQIRNRDLIVVVLGSVDRMARAQQLIKEAWPLYDGWAAAGFQVSPKGSELITVPAL